jgi:Putative Ig domain
MAAAHPFNIVATDSLGATATQLFTLNLAPAAGVAPTLPAQTAPSGVIGQTYSYQIVGASPTGGTYSISPAVSGWSINPSTGLLTGTPAAANTNVTVVYSNGTLPDAARVISVSAVAQGDFLKNVAQSTFYSHTSTVTGTAPITCTPSNLPTGLAWNASTKTFSAAAFAMAKGAYNVPMTCTNCSGASSSTKTYTFWVQ